MIFYLKPKLNPKAFETAVKLSIFCLLSTQNLFLKNETKIIPETEKKKMNSLNFMKYLFLLPNAARFYVSCAITNTSHF